MKEGNAMENMLHFADTVMECVVEPARRTSQPPVWLGIVECCVQFLKILWLCGQVLAWIGV